MAGIKDVAKRAGVSISTVSRYINQSAPVNEDKGRAIKEAMDFYKYAPSQFGRGLKVRKSRLIGVCLNGNGGGSIFDTSYGVELLKGMEQALQDRDYSIMMINESGAGRTSRDDVPEFVRFVRENKIDGLVVSAITDPELRDRTISELKEKDFPFVYIGRDCGCADYNVYAGYVSYHANMVKYLTDSGHRTLTILYQIHAGFEQNVQKAVDELCGDTDSYIDILKPNMTDTELMAYLQYWVRERGINGISSPGMDVTYRLYRCLRELGYSIPGDISIISVESRLGEGEGMIPRTSACVIKTYEMGIEAASILVDCIEGRDPGRRKVYLEPRCVERDSVLARRQE